MMSEKSLFLLTPPLPFFSPPLSLWLNQNFKNQWQKEKEKKWKEEQQPNVFVFMFFLDSINIINNINLFWYYRLFGNLINSSDGNLPDHPHTHTHRHSHSHTTRAQCLEVYSLIVKRMKETFYYFKHNPVYPFLFFFVFLLRFCLVKS